MLKKISSLFHYLIDIIFVIVRNVALIIKVRSIKHFYHFEKTNNKIAFIIANGASASNCVDVLNDTPVHSREIFVMNFFCNSELFEEIKPENYCLIDPAFFKKHEEEKFIEFYNNLNKKVQWKMNLYISAWYPIEQFLKTSMLKNENITIIPVNTITCPDLFVKVSHLLYDLRLSSPIMGTVLSLCIFVAMKRKFTEIRLYGVEHNFFKNLMVDDKNQVCNYEEHFYNEKKIIVPIKHSMSDFLFDKYKMFKGHEQLNKYSLHRQCRVVNYTQNSLVDAYERCSQFNGDK